MNKKTKAVLIELSIYTILFTLVIILLPMCNFYYEDDLIGMRTEPQYMSDFKIAYAFPVYFLIVLFGFLSLNKAISITMNILVLVLMFLTFCIIGLGFAWWGASGFHPDFRIGYGLSQVILIVLVVRAFTLIPIRSELNFGKSFRRSLSILAIAFPAVFIIYILLLANAANNEPILRSEWHHIDRDRSIKEESWDYPGYNAYAHKYFSRDTLKTETFQLDSVEFTYFDDESNIVKRFTRKTKNVDLDIEEILDQNEP